MRRIISSTAALLAVLVGTLAYTIARPTEADAGLMPTYRITGTEIGIFFRTDPRNWNHPSTNLTTRHTIEL